MTCDSGTDTDFCGFRVTHLTDHNDIRVLTEDGTEGSGKGHARLGVYLNLVDAVDLLLHRVLNGDDVYVGLCKLTQGGIQGSGLTGTGRPCYQHNPVGTLDHALEHAVVVVGHTQIGDLPQGNLTGGKNTDNDLLAVYGRQGRYTDVQGGAVYDLCETTVLGHTLLGDVHAGYQLQTGGQGVMYLICNVHQLYQISVNTDPDPGVGLEGLDMDIRCIRTEGVFYDGGSQLYDGGAVYTILGAVIVLILYWIQSAYALQHAVHVLHGVVLTDHFLDGSLGCQHRNCIHTGGNLDILQNVEVDGIVRGNGQTATLNVDGDDCMLQRQRLRHLPNGFLVDVHGGQIHIRHLQLAGKCLCKLCFRKEAQFHDHVAEPLGALRFSLCLQYLLKLFLCNQSLLNQVIADTDISHYPNLQYIFVFSGNAVLAAHPCIYSEFMLE